jgi:hypothetical protein
MERTIALLYRTYELSQAGVLSNVILYGPPGYAKSQVAKGFLEVMGHPSPKKHQFSAGTSIQSLIGMMKLKDLDEGKITMNIDSSFISHPVAIFEEMFNAPPHVLAVLIDILMSGEYCVEGNVCYKSQCKYIIACTNIVPEEWIAAADDTRKAVFEAFSERFPFQQEVSWNDHSSSAYADLVEKVLKTRSDTFCEMMEYAHTQGKTISPRTAVIAARAYLTPSTDPTLKPIESLQNLKGIDKGLYSEFKMMDARKEQLEHQLAWEKEAKILHKNVRKASAGDLKMVIDELTRYSPKLDQQMTTILVELRQQLEKLESDFLAKTLYGNNQQ